VLGAALCKIGSGASKINSIDGNTTEFLLQCINKTLPLDCAYREAQLIFRKFCPRTHLGVCLYACLENPNNLAASRTELLILAVHLLIFPSNVYESIKRLSTAQKYIAYALHGFIFTSFPCSATKFQGPNAAAED
jgi:hypothetical protein